MSEENVMDAIGEVNRNLLRVAEALEAIVNAIVRGNPAGNPDASHVEIFATVHNQ